MNLGLACRFFWLIPEFWFKYRLSFGYWFLLTWRTNTPSHSDPLDSPRNALVSDLDLVVTISLARENSDVTVLVLVQITNSCFGVHSRLS